MNFGPLTKIIDSNIVEKQISFPVQKIPKLRQKVIFIVIIVIS